MVMTRSTARRIRRGYRKVKKVFGGARRPRATIRGQLRKAESNPATRRARGERKARQTERAKVGRGGMTKMGMRKSLREKRSAHAARLKGVRSDAQRLRTERKAKSKKGSGKGALAAAVKGYQKRIKQWGKAKGSQMKGAGKSWSVKLAPKGKKRSKKLPHAPTARKVLQSFPKATKRLT